MSLVPATEVIVQLNPQRLVLVFLLGSAGCAVVRPREAPREARACESIRGGLLAVADIASDAPDVPVQHALLIGQVLREAAVRELPDMGVLSRAEWNAALDDVGEDGDPGWGRTQADLARRAGAEAVVSGELRRSPAGYLLDLRAQQASDGHLLSRVQLRAATFAELLAQERGATHALLAPVGILTPLEYDRP